MRNKKYYIFLIFVFVIALSAIMISCSNNETILFENNLNSVSLVDGTTLTDYTINYSGLDGAAIDSNPDSYNEETETFTLNNPTKVGYSFLGWSGTDIEDKSTSVQIIKGSTGNREYTANWEIISYNITYSGVAGANNSANPKIYTYESTTITLQDPIKEGYTFLGWTTTEVTTPAKSLTIDQGSTGAKSFTANWQANTYTITYDVNAGDELVINTQEVIFDESITLVIPTRMGYDFDGWYNGSSLVQEGTWNIASNVTLKANWKIINYTIDYIGAIVANMSSYNVETETFTLNNQRKLGYNFVGWSGTDIDGISTNVQITKGSTGNREYKANWEVVTYTVEYYFDGESLGDEYKQTYTIEDQNFAVKTLDKEHYRLINWKEDLTSETSINTINTSSCKDIVLHANCEKLYNFTISYTDNLASTGTMPIAISNNTFAEMANSLYDKVKDGLKGFTLKILDNHNSMITYAAYYSDEGDLSNNGLLSPAINYSSSEEDWYNVSIYVKKEINIYTIEYDLDGGAFNPAKTIYNVNDSFTIGTPTKVGYDFVGWDDGNSESLIFEVFSGTTGKLKLTAKWEAKTLIVHFDNANITSTITVKYDSKYGALPVPEKEGYTFEYWILEDTAKRINEDSKVETSENHTLNAKFKPNQYFVNYKLYDGEEKNYTATFDSSVTADQNNASMLIDPTREGYTFIKWVKNDEDFVVPTTRWNISENVSIEAVWKANDYNVTLSVKDKEYKFNATYDSSISLLTEEIKNYVGNDYIASFSDEDGNLFANYTGVNEKYTYAKDIKVYANILLVGNEFTSNVNLDMTKLYNQISVSIDGNKITSLDNFNLNSIGNHKIRYLSSDANELYSIEIVVKENIGLENNAHYKDVPVVNLDGQEIVSLKIDGKEYRYIEGNPNRLTKNGKHTIEITGANGYSVTYIVYFDNPNYTAFWYILGITIILLLGVSIYSFLGRRNTIPYDYLDRR